MGKSPRWRQVAGYVVVPIFDRHIPGLISTGKRNPANQNNNHGWVALLAGFISIDYDNSPFHPGMGHDTHNINFADHL